MAYFQRDSRTEESYTRQFAPARTEEADWEEEEYDDGFDELMEPEDLPEEEIPEEELRQEKARKFRVAAGFGNFGAIVAGALAILALTAFLIQMLRFVSSDFAQNFSIWQTKF